MSAKVRNILFVLCGAAGLVLKGRYRGPYQVAVHSYGGNLAASFAVYFVLANLPIFTRLGRLRTAGCALAIVGLFEATDGFHLMANTYDPIDYAVNAAGIALALVADVATSRVTRVSPPQGPPV